MRKSLRGEKENGKEMRRERERERNEDGQRVKKIGIKENKRKENLKKKERRRKINK